jgi:hypothetical protein
MNVSLPSFASEGVARRPTLAIVGDTPDAEYILREGTLKSVISDTVARVMNNLTQHLTTNYVTQTGESDKNVQIKIENNFNRPETSYYEAHREMEMIGKRLGAQFR